MSLPATELRRTETGLSREREPRARFANCLKRLRGESGVAVVHLSAPNADPSLLLSLEGFDASFLWTPPDGFAIAGLGEAARIEATGDDRFERVRDSARALFERMHVVGAGPKPRLYGGFAFAPGAATVAPWAPFGDARFSLPRWSFVRGNAAATLTFAAVAKGWSDEDERRALSELDLILGALTHPAEERPTPVVRSVVHQDPRRFEAQVQQIVQAIDAGVFEKVVAARRSEVVLDAAIDPATVARRLSRRFSGCTTFAFRHGRATFLGATPERLLSLSGKTVRTEALAGTAPASDPHAERVLMNSDKDLEEHALVVREVERRLTSVAGAIRRPRRPAIRRLPNVLHLETPITAELERDLHVLDVAARLHPTPAVGGIPRQEAVDWIVARENAPRGWYSGPVGWIDAHGDGELSVALRSGLLVGDRAFVWAGGGIVRDSKPRDEYEEAAVKLGALLDALMGRGAQ